MLQLPLAWADLLGLLCGRRTEHNINRALAGLRESGLVQHLNMAVWPGHSPRFYHLTDLGLGVISHQRGEDVNVLARRHGARWADLLAMVPSIEWVAACCDIFTALAQGRGQGLVDLHWQRPWHGRYRSPQSRTLTYVQMPAWLRLSWENEYLECFLLPDRGTFPTDVYRARLFKLAAYSRGVYNWRMPPMAIVADGPQRLEQWRRLVDYVVRTSRGSLPGLLTTWERIWDDLPSLPAVASPITPKVPVGGALE